MEHRFTRQEIYNRVWSTPMTRVAAELGTTTGRLSSLLRRAGIPTPPSGYWIKKEFGKGVTQPPLPPVPPDCPEPLVLDAETTRARRPRNNRAQEQASGAITFRTRGNIRTGCFLTPRTRASPFSANDTDSRRALCCCVANAHVAVGRTVRDQRQRPRQDLPSGRHSIPAAWLLGETRG